MSHKTTNFHIQREVSDSGYTHWKDHGEPFTGIREVEAALAASIRKLSDRRPSSYTGRFRIICRSVTEHDVGEIIDINPPAGSVDK